MAKDRWNLLLDAEAGQTLFLWRVDILKSRDDSHVRWQSRDKESRKNLNIRLTVDVDISQESVVTALL